MSENKFKTVEDRIKEDPNKIWQVHLCGNKEIRKIKPYPNVVCSMCNSDSSGSADLEISSCILQAILYAQYNYSENNLVDTFSDKEDFESKENRLKSEIIKAHSTRVDEFLKTVKKPTIS